MGRVESVDRIVFIQEELARLELLQKKLNDCDGLNKKIVFLSGLSIVQEFLQTNEFLARFMLAQDPKTQNVLLSVLAIDQGNSLFIQLETVENKEDKLRVLIQKLLNIEHFYDTIGGLIGYHLCVLRLILEDEAPAKNQSRKSVYFHPVGYDLTKPSQSVDEAVRAGIEGLPRMGEIYPIGGAGDRLQLIDEVSGEHLPAAVLIFLGRTLLAHLIRDVQAKEYLHYKLIGGQINVPIAMMTSHEKNNHEHILSICENENWFGRPKDFFRFFTQELVPVISLDGHWLMKAPLEMHLKPGGHGVIWKQASDEGVLDWFLEKGAAAFLIRQINNPIAGTDNAILAFTGYGCKEKKSFGFASCRRLVNAAEGVNVLREQSNGKGYYYCITNIEYMDLEKKGIADAPSELGTPYSAFPANTNILYADILSIKKAIEGNPNPGMIINMKTKFKSLSPNGETQEIKGGRLESTMQNIADEIIDIFPSKQDIHQKLPLKTFLTYNIRRKTLSVTKNSYHSGHSIAGTPVGCLYEILQNAHELLSSFCGFQLPCFPNEGDFLAKGPSFIFLFHSALGPNWSIIAQKVRGGHFAYGAEMQLEVAEVDFENVSLEGSLLVEARETLGRRTPEGVLNYGEECGKCSLKNVRIINKGIDRKANNTYWKNDIKRKEAFKIILNGNAEFHAENVILEGNALIEVPDGCRMVAFDDGGALRFKQEPIHTHTWAWSYTFDDDSKIILKIAPVSERPKVP